MVVTDCIPFRTCMSVAGLNFFVSKENFIPVCLVARCSRESSRSSSLGRFTVVLKTDWALTDRTIISDTADMNHFILNGIFDF
jgi:hypothetical protein